MTNGQQIAVALATLFVLIPLQGRAEEPTLEWAAKKEASYLALEHPTYEQRFEFQRWRSQALKIAETKGWTRLLQDRAEGRRDYGLDPDDYNISFFEWQKRPEFALEAYRQDSGAVSYRGLHLEPGDILLTNLASDSDGIYTTLAEGRRSFSHVAAYVLLENEGRKFPAVVEIHDEGVRAVPLRFFLSDKFVSYVEVYRQLGLTERTRNTLGAVALAMMRESHGFDFYMNESQSVYLTCALTVSHLFRRAGIEPAKEESRYDPLKQANIRFLGFESELGRKLLLPDDFAASPKLKLVGVVDNAQFMQKMARDLVRDHIQEIFVTEQLDATRFPWDFYVYRFAVNSIQHRSWIAPLLLKVLGFRRDNFPSGPAMFLALAKPAFERVEESSRKLAKLLASHETAIQKARSWDELETNPEIRALVSEASEGFEALCSKAPPAKNTAAAPALSGPSRWVAAATSTLTSFWPAR
jgi:Permuted papain-like amidase enzyme, YaeF/YiiX, C92 family